MTTVTITIPLEVTDQQCADIFCTAIEGGIGYWSQCRKIVRKLAPALSDNDLADYVSCELAELNDDESGYDWTRPIKLDYDAIRRGISRICTDDRFSHLRAAVVNDIRDNDVGCYIDADVADCIVQIGLFDEIRYG